MSVFPQRTTVLVINYSYHLTKHSAGLFNTSFTTRLPPSPPPPPSPPLPPDGQHLLVVSDTYGQHAVSYAWAEHSRCKSDNAEWFAMAAHFLMAQALVRFHRTCQHSHLTGSLRLPFLPAVTSNRLLWNVATGLKFPAIPSMRKGAI